MAKTVVAALEEDSLVYEKERFFRFDKESLKRPGVILRLCSILVAMVAIVLTAILPMVLIDYRIYLNSATFDAARANRFPTETISGLNNLFGGGYFAYYLKSEDLPHLLYTAKASFNWILAIIILAVFVFMALAFMTTFSKKLEKLSKLITLGYIVGGIGVVCAPIWFMVVNAFGNTYDYNKTNITQYFSYDSIYVHAAWGAVVAGLVYVVAAICFAIGTNLEQAGGEQRG